MKMANSTCWNITNKCNDHCQFCYRDQTSPDLDLKGRFAVIDNIAASGIRKLTFVGGEPLLVAEIKELIQYAKQKGLLVSMTTNSILLDDQMLDFCMTHLNWLTLSLDGATTEVQSQMSRNPNHANRVKEVLSAAANKEGSCKFKINSVVSRVNLDHIEELAEWVAAYPIARWKLFQFVPLRGTSKRNSDKFLISNQEFYQAVEKARIRLKEKSNILSVSDKENIRDAYFIIAPNGDVKSSHDLQEQCLGNAQYDNLKEIWNRGFYNYQLHEARTQSYIDMP